MGYYTHEQKDQTVVLFRPQLLPPVTLVQIHKTHTQSLSTAKPQN